MTYWDHLHQVGSPIECIIDILINLIIIIISARKTIKEVVSGEPPLLGVVADLVKFVW